MRLLRLADHPAVLALFEWSGLPPRPRGRDRRDAFAKQLRSNRTAYVGAFEEDRLVGVVLGTHDTRKGWINRLAVHPDCPRRGIAQCLVRACERSLTAEGMRMFAALVEPGNEASELLFRSLGYETMPMVYARRKLRAEV